jgi:hypothetical protein
MQNKQNSEIRSFEVLNTISKKPAASVSGIEALHVPGYSKVGINGGYK